MESHPVGRCAQTELGGESRIWHLVLGVAIVVWTFLLGCTPLRDFDVWWHIRTGQLILERGAVPETDWFTYTNSDQPWIDLHWAGQVAVALLYRLGGVNAILLGKATAGALAVALGWAASGRRLPLWIKTGVWIVGVTAFAGRILERPDTISVLALSCWIYLLSSAVDHPRRLWLLPLLQVVWVNFHALSVLGLIVGAIFAADRLFRRVAAGRWGADPCEPLLPWKSSVAISLSVAGASFVSPYGVRGALFPLELFRKLSTDRDFYSARIVEFQSPFHYLEANGFDTIYLAAAIVLLLIAVASFVAVYSSERFSLFRLGVFFAFTYLALTAVRNINLWVLAAAPIVCWNLRDSLASLPWSGRAGVAARPRRTPCGASAASLATVLLLTASVASGWWGAHLGARWGGYFRLGLFDDEYFAVDAVRFAGKEGLPRHAFLSPFGLASVFMFEHGPDRTVFMDPRLEVNTQQTFEKWELACKLMAQGNPDWEALVCDETGALPVLVLDVRYLLPGVASLLQNPRWRMVFADGAAAVFAPREIADSEGFAPADPRGLWWFELFPDSIRQAIEH